MDNDMTADHDWLGLRDARVLIAGAGGLGAACAAAFLAAGSRVQVVDAAPERAATAIAGTPDDRAAATGADLTQAAGATRAVGDICQRWGGIDVCVHAVGINIRKPVLECDDTEWAATVEVNLTTAWLLCREAGRRMTAAGHGSIVVFSSVSGLLAHRNHGPYAATKGAINQMIRVMAVEWAPHGVTVNAVAPGYVDTGLTRAYLERDGNRARLEGLVPAGRLSTPEEVAGPVLFLASKQARYVTGHILYVDGGRTLL
jgi:NAD(P)-dependent dehydrogenase (short-subunit alcohol dehydrogenase family)